MNNIKSAKVSIDSVNINSSLDKESLLEYSQDYDEFRLT